MVAPKLNLKNQSVFRSLLYLIVFELNENNANGVAETKDQTFSEPGRTIWVIVLWSKIAIIHRENQYKVEIIN